MVEQSSEYNRKRNFNVTSEPREGTKTGRNKRLGALSFVIQKHDARRLHYDFRLELDGTLKSWAIPKGPSLDPKDKRLAVHVEDHPLGYANFEGSIPKGQYGGGDVIVWDRGVWQPHGDPESGYKAGKLKFTLIGEKLAGDWNLVRTNLRGSGDKEQWLLIKERDSSARPAEEYDVVEQQPQSVLSKALIDSATATKKTSKKNSTAALEPPRAHAKPSARATSSAKTNNPIKSTTGSVAARAKPTKKTARDKPVVLPEFLPPELATLVDEPPPGDWLYEIKFDGYRLLARILKGEVRLFTRKGNDWTHRLPRQVEAIEKLKLGDTWLDGEVVVLNDQGLPDFQALQNAFDIGRSHDIVYYLFDAPYLNGKDLRAAPVEERRAALQNIMPRKANPLLRFSDAFDAPHRDIVASACAMSLEGIIGKRAGSTYQSRRSLDWIKLKCRLRQEFVIVGYTAPQGSRTGFGALLLGVYSGGDKKNALVYAGRVGTGFNQVSLKQLHGRLRELGQEGSPLATPLRGAQARGVHWVTPELVCEVEFAEWTGENVLRQAAFIALRSDKPATEIIRERALATDTLQPLAAIASGTGEKEGVVNMSTAKTTAGKSTGKRQAAANRVADITITHPERVIDLDTGAQKKDLAAFYAGISQWMLPHLKGRPVSLLRAPEGVTGEQFFQKHVAHLDIPGIKQLDPKLDPGHASLMEIDTVEALVGAIQMGTVELHTWGATSNRIETPDRFILDLDPDPALPWRSMIDATRLTLAVLDELKLDACLKTSGGKGIHLVVPLARQAQWDEVKAFAKAISEFMAQQIPERFVAKMGPKNRIGKIFIDYLRNNRGASTVCAYSVRARPGLPVSVPIARLELEKLTSAAQWNIHNLHQRLEQQKEDPWAGCSKRQRITRAMWKRLGANPP